MAASLLTKVTTLRSCLSHPEQAHCVSIWVLQYSNQHAVQLIRHVAYQPLAAPRLQDAIRKFKGYDAYTRTSFVKATVKNPKAVSRAAKIISETRHKRSS